MAQITTEQHAAAFENADLGEAFEVFIQQRYYFEVLNLTGGIYATLSEFKVGSFFNASYWFAADEAMKTQLKTSGELTETFYKFDTMAEAIAFSNELLKIVVSDI